MKEATRKLGLVCLVVLLGVLAGDRSALALTTQTTMSVTMAVGNACTVSAATLAFGNYDPIVTNKTSPLNGSTTLTVTCTTGAAYTVTISQGGNPATGSTATAPARQLTNGATTPSLASYSLFRDSARTLIWGDAATVGQTGTGTGAAQTLTVFGSVGAGQNLPQGAFTDTDTVTVTF